MIFCDFETRSDADIRKVGGRRYAEHPSTEVVCLVAFSAATGQWYEITDGGLPPFDPDGLAAAHNAVDFDRHVWASLGWPPPERWVDTAELARKAGMRASLDALGTRLLGRPKDDAGNALTLSLSGYSCRPGVPEEFRPALREYHRARKTLRGSGQWPPVPPAILARVIEYCRADVGLMAETWPFLADFDGAEPEVELADRAVNDRGVMFDVELARSLLDHDARMTAAALASVGLTGVELKSPARFRAHVLAAGGPDLPDAKFASVEPLLRSALPRVRALATARLSLNSIARGKLEAGFRRVSDDGRLRDMQRAYGAHTWRWAGRGFQTQNIPWIDKLGAAAKAAKKRGEA